VNPVQIIQSYTPTYSETKKELTEMYTQFARAAICLYIIFIVSTMEIHHKIKNRKAGALYLLTLNGIVDLGIVVAVLTSCAWRQVVFARNTGKALLETNDDQIVSPPNGFYSTAKYGSLCEGLFIIDGLSFLLIMFRMISFFRLSLRVYILWQALGLAFFQHVFFNMMFAPITFGFAVLAHKVWGTLLPGFETISGTFLQLYLLIRGQLDLSVLYAAEPVWTLLLIFFFYIIALFLLINIFVSVTISSYYVIQLTASNPGITWDRKRIVQWFVPGLFVSLFQALYGSTSGGEL